MIIIRVLFPRAGPSLHTREPKVVVLLEGMSSKANSGNQAAVLLGMDRRGSFSMLSAPHAFFRILTDLKRSEKIPGAPS